MGITIPYSEKDINQASNEIISVQKIENGYVRPMIWRGSEMMAISAQKTKIHVETNSNIKTVKIRWVNK